MTWEEFKEQDPELASLGEDRFKSTGLVILSTLRKNGWPRISPVELLFFEGNIHLGMIWRSLKALDLRRDPKCTLHNTVSNPDASEGAFRLYGRAEEIFDLAHRSRFAEAVFLQTGYRPEEPDFHLFTIDIDSASFTEIKEGAISHRVWPTSGKSLDS